MSASASASVSAATVLAVLFGLGVGVGLLLVIVGWRGVDPTRPSGFLRRASLRHGQDHGQDNRSRDQRRTLRITVAVTIGLVTGVATGWIVGAVLAGLAVWALPRVLGRDQQHARRVARIEAIATWTEMLRDTLSAAAGLEQTILATAPLAPPAIRGEVTALATRIENGDRLAPSLRALADRLADPTGDLVIAALVLAAEQQARQLGDLLGSLAQTAREQASMRMRIEAGRARTRTSVRVIVGTTLCFASAVVVLNRPYLSVYDTIAGQAVLLGIGVLFALGFAWLARIATVTEPGRVLTTADNAAADTALVTERQV